MKKPTWKAEARNVIPFSKLYNHISAIDLENILETLEDKGYLTESGIKFRDAFWRLFIREK
jgi:hypothetical protein